MLYVYAVLMERPRAPLGEGAAGEALDVLGPGPVAVVGEMPRRPDPSPEALRAHDTVVRRLHAQERAVLPARFGQCITPEELARALDGRAAALREALEAVAGCVQMNVRIPVGGLRREVPEEDGRLGPGTRYMRRRRAAQAPAPELEELCRRVAPLVRRQSAATPPAEGMATVYHLVARDDIGRYQELCRAVSSDARVSGPWPPYAFSEALS